MIYINLMGGLGNILFQYMCCYSISKKYNISVDELKRKNNISDTGISIGQKLIVK